MKSIKVYSAIIVLLVLTLGMTVQAQEKKQAVSNDQAWLQKFVGTWTAKVVSTDDKKQTTTLTSNIDFTSIADGSGVYGVESFDDPKLGKFRASYLLGYDSYEKKIHYYAVNNMGVCHDHACTWKSPDHFYMEHNSKRDGKSFKEEINLVLKDKNTLDYSETDSLDGKIIETDKGTFTKVK